MKNKERKRKKGKFYKASGVLLGTAALLLAGYNLWNDYQSGKYADDALQLILNMVPERVGTVEEQLQEVFSASEVEYPDYMLNPNMEMTVRMIQGQEYIGVIEFPTLSLKLPVISEWSEERLKLAPCRYTGSVYMNDMIVAGHSYKNHFRKIRKLQVGAPVVYTDMDGNRFVYEVIGTEVIEGTDVEQMEKGEWDFTIFTCTPNGGSRYTVRCVLADGENRMIKY